MGKRMPDGNSRSRIEFCVMAFSAKGTRVQNAVCQETVFDCDSGEGARWVMGEPWLVLEFSTETKARLIVSAIGANVVLGLPTVQRGQLARSHPTRTNKENTINAET
jgi:hypothetical protein